MTKRIKIPMPFQVGKIYGHIFQLDGRTVSLFVPMAGHIRLEDSASDQNVRLAEDTVIHYIDYLDG